MLTRDEIMRLQVECGGAKSFRWATSTEQDALCTMALALLDVVDELPAYLTDDGDLAKRARLLRMDIDSLRATVVYEAAIDREVDPTWENDKPDEPLGQHNWLQHVRYQRWLRVTAASKLAAIEELVPGDGDIVERVRKYLSLGKFAADEASEACDDVEELSQQLRRAETERDDAKRRIEGLASQRLCAEFARVDRERNELRAKGDALAEAARRVLHGSGPRDIEENGDALDAAIAEWRKEHTKC